MERKRLTAEYLESICQTCYVEAKDGSTMTETIASISRDYPELDREDIRMTVRCLFRRAKGLVKLARMERNIENTQAMVRRNRKKAGLPV